LAALQKAMKMVQPLAGLPRFGGEIGPQKKRRVFAGLSRLLRTTSVQLGDHRPRSSTGQRLF